MDNVKPDYRKDELLSEHAIKMMRERYLWGDEKSPQDAFRRASIYGATFKGTTDWALANRLYTYCSNLWFMFATPVLSNGGTTRGYPISCFLNHVPDSRQGLSEHYDENIWLASGGGGIGSYWGSVRSDGSATSNGSKSTGCIPFMHVVDSQMLAFNQGTNRRGACATYMDISHPEVEEFIDMRKTTGGDPHRRNTNLHHGVVVDVPFLHAVENDYKWELIDPHSKAVMKTVKARDLWFKILETRAETGEPYLFNKSLTNALLPVNLKSKGLEVKHSNLCTEITLPTDENRTAVCCLSSVNVEKFDEWEVHPYFISDMVTMLDNILQNFIDEAGHSPGMRKAVYSAKQERSIGLGAMGFHSFLQGKNVPIESALAKSLNRRVFKNIYDNARSTSAKLGELRGEAPDMVGTGMRNAHLLAIAPNASSSVICGNTSPSIEPYRANVYTQKGVAGFSQVRNKHLAKLLHERLDGDKKAIDQVWDNIYNDEGSVANIDILTEYEKDVFKTAPEINQHYLVELAIDRQNYICQAQSLNLFFVPPSKEAPTEVHTTFLQYVSDVHLRAISNLKSVYYYRGREASKVENVNLKIPKRVESECLSCEG